MLIFIDCKFKIIQIYKKFIPLVNNAFHSFASLLFDWDYGVLRGIYLFNLFQYAGKTKRLYELRRVCEFISKLFGNGPNDNITIGPFARIQPPSEQSAGK